MERRRPFRRAHGRLGLIAAGAASLLTAPAAQAHTTFQGLGEFGSGFLHPLTTPAHVLVLLALGLSLGQHAPLRLAAPVAAFAGCATVGLLASWGVGFAGLPSPWLVGVGLCTAGLVVAARPLPGPVRVGLGGVAALLLGLDSGVDPGTPGLAAAKTLFATGVSLVLLVVNVAFYVSLLPPREWARVGVRVAASWIAAVGLLMLAFALRR